MSTEQPQRSALLCTGPTYRAFQLISNERQLQEEKWGDMGTHERNRNLDLETRLVWYLAVLLEETGELAKSCLKDNPEEEHSLEAKKREARHVATVATAILELLYE